MDLRFFLSPGNHQHITYGTGRGKTSFLSYLLLMRLSEARLSNPSPSPSVTSPDGQNNLIIQCCCSLLHIAYHKSGVG
ncbi:hypothetical protein E2C01_024288 [Portunus trituberculatus]|uniref:Uncharacterized protein n=1 Tax=Portunus trituberculatus TaxID=210409 RepID=A0A5B7ECB7_PORTR|nr:hypothetical protein [Portunus trituberculatus]